MQRCGRAHRFCLDNVAADCRAELPSDALGWPCLQRCGLCYDAASSRHDEPMLFDTATDPTQQTDLAGTGDPDEERMRDFLVTAFDEMNVRRSQYERLGLTGSS